MSGRIRLKSIFVKENWTIEVDTSGGAKVDIRTTFMNVSNEEQRLVLFYKHNFTREEKPDYFRYNDGEVSSIRGSYVTPTNFSIKPLGTKEIRADIGYADLARAENDWWKISLCLRYGDVSPNELTIECFLPMEAEDIRVRNDIPSLIDPHNKKVTVFFTGEPYSVKLAYRLKGRAGHKETEGSRTEALLSVEDVKRIRNSMPLLCSLPGIVLSNLGDKKPFRNKNFLIVLHFLKDLIVFLEACEKLGLETDKTYLFYKPYLYPHKDLVASHLKTKGYERIYPLEMLESVSESLDQQQSTKDLIVLEDGGYIVPLLHQKFPNLLEKTIGAVEQTTKGITNDKALPSIAIPILNVAEANLKTKIEPPYIADAVVQNIRNLLSFEKLRGERAALLGYGHIGREVVERLRSGGMRITVYDPSEDVRTEARDKGYDVELEPYNAVRNKLLVIGCSGKTSVTYKEILSLRHGTYLVSASSDQMEIDIPMLKAFSEEKQPLRDISGNVIGTSCVIREKNLEVRLLADGYPINFWCSESMPNQVSDLILSMILLSAFELAVNAYPKGIRNIDRIVSKHRVSEIYESYYRE